MKQYVVDELRLEDYEKIKRFFADNSGTSFQDAFRIKSASVEGVYWLELPHELLNETQAAHEDCQPFNFAIELEEDSLSCGLLVRAASNIRCHCIEYANTTQRNWLINIIDSIMEQNEIVI